MIRCNYCKCNLDGKISYQIRIGGMDGDEWDADEDVGYFCINCHDVYDADGWKGLRALTIVRFAHAYPKLKNKTFTTIRAKSYPVEAGDWVKVVCQGKSLGMYACDRTDVMKIENFDLAFLQADGNYEGHEITSHEDFIQLLNSFTGFTNHRLTTKKKALYLRKLD